MPGFAGSRGYANDNQTIQYAIDEYVAHLIAACGQYDDDGDKADALDAAIVTLQAQVTTWNT